MILAPSIEYTWDDNQEKFTDVQFGNSNWRFTKPECRQHLIPTAPSKDTATAFHKESVVLSHQEGFTQEQKEGKTDQSDQSIADQFFRCDLINAIKDHNLSQVRPPTESCATTGGTNTRGGTHKVALVSLAQMSEIDSNANRTQFPPTAGISPSELSDATFCPLEQRQLVHEDLWRDDSYVHRVSLAPAQTMGRTPDTGHSGAPGDYTSKGFDSVLYANQKREEKEFWNARDDMKSTHPEI
ncbi:hypothetical protein IAT40_007073 [Kwoniella sp. CBS 6097]